MLKQILISGVMTSALAMTAPAMAATVYASGATTAASPSGFTPVIDFLAPGGTQVDVTVTDCCIGGDYYATYLDGAYIGTTPFEPEYGSTLSSATFLATLGAGPSHTLQMQDEADFLLPAGLTYEVTSVSAAPEPQSWALMILGVLGLGVALRTSRRARERLACQAA